MCQRCQEIERQLKQHLRTYSNTDDEHVLSLLAAAMADLEAEKAALHPTEMKSG